jgi:hypothetical protein
MRGSTLGFGQEICVNGNGPCEKQSRGTATRSAQVMDSSDPSSGTIFAKYSNSSLLCGVLTVMLVGTGVGIGSWYVATM